MERAGRLITKLKTPPGAISPEALALAGWPAAVGKTIAAHTRALWLVSSRLVVETEDQIWQRQLAALKTQILKRLDGVLGESVVSEVEFRLPARRRGPQRAEQPQQGIAEGERRERPPLRSIFKQRRNRRSA